MDLILPKFNDRGTADLWIRGASHSNFLQCLLLDVTEQLHVLLRHDFLAPEESLLTFWLAVPAVLIVCGPVGSARLPVALFPDSVLLGVVNHLPPGFPPIGGRGEELGKAIDEPFGFLVELQGGTALSAEVQAIYSL